MENHSGVDQAKNLSIFLLLLMLTPNPSPKTQHTISSCHLNATALAETPSSVCCVTLGYLFWSLLRGLNELLFVVNSVQHIGSPM